MALEPITYDESNATFTVPTGVAATLVGSDDTITLSADDTLLTADGSYGSTVDSASTGLAIEVGTDSTLTIVAPQPAIALDPVANVTILHGGDVTFAPADADQGSPLITVDNEDLSALTTITGSVAARITIEAGAAVDLTDPAASVSIAGSDGTNAFNGISGTASYAFRANPDNVDGVVDLISGATQANLQGAYAGEIADFTNGTSELLLPGSGYFGIYAENTYFSQPEANGYEVSSVLDVYNGSTDTSIFQVYAPLDDGSGIIGGYALYSGPDATGTETANFNFDTGASGHFAPFPSGAFGCYQVATYYTGANETGQAYETSDDFVNGTSRSTLTTNGGFGCYQAEVRTDGFNSDGDITQVTLDFVGGVSRTITPISVGGEETDVYTSGPGGTGSVLSSTVDPAGTAAAALTAFTGLDFTASSAAVATTVKAAFAKASVTHADFAATKGSAAAMVAADPIAGIRVPAASPLGGIGEAMRQPIAPAVLLHAV